MLKLADVTVAFGGVRALDGVTFGVGDGEVLGLLGPNGSGKTTALNAITGYVRAKSGSIKFAGVELLGRSVDAIARVGVRRTYQNLRIFPEWTVRQNVALGIEIHDWKATVETGFGRQRHLDDSRVADAIELVGLGGLEDRNADLLSYGHKRRLEVARAVVSQPRLLLLDEPVAGMAEDERLEVEQIVAAVRDRGTACVVIDHDVDFVLRLATRVIVLAFGRVIAEDAPTMIRTNRAVIEAYLGSGAARSGGVRIDA